MIPSLAAPARKLGTPTGTRKRLDLPSAEAMKGSPRWGLSYSPRISRDRILVNSQLLGYGSHFDVR